MDINSDSIVAIVGAGTMGAGIAQVAATAGHRVWVIDSQQTALNRARDGVAKALASLVRKARLTAEAQQDIEARIGWTTTIDDARQAKLVIEAIVERFDAKVGLFTTLSAIMPPTTVMATNTSSLSVDAMAAAIPGPQRFAGLHFFNPVPAMKLVEVVPGQRTDPAITAALMALMERWNKCPVQVRDVPGFIVNRVARPYYAEGFKALDEGIDAAIIDHALTGAGGFRMGPLALADLIGQDVNYAVACSVFDAYGGKARFRPQPTQQALVEAGTFGRKSGSGVYGYTGDLPAPATIVPGAGPKEITIRTGSAFSMLLGVTTWPKELRLSETSALPAESLRIDNMLAAMGDGRRLAERADVDILIDHPRDFATASLLVVTTKNDEAAALAAAFAAAIGKVAVDLPDRPGQIVLRTLSQLANAAADAVADSVASAEDIDNAMRFGANHPEGPLEWAKRFGQERVSEALAHICAATGDPIYAPSSAFLKRGRA